MSNTTTIPAIHRRVGAPPWLPPEGCRECNSSANPPVIPVTAAHCRRCTRVWNTAAARSKVNASSTTRTGCTRASGPVARAPACSPKPTMIVAIPVHHPGLCARSHIMARPEAEASGCSRATLRCSTDELVLANAAAVAYATLSSTATAGRADAGRDDPARIPAGVDGGPRTPCCADVSPHPGCSPHRELAV